MSNNSGKLNPILRNQTKFLSGTSVSRLPSGGRIMNFDSLFRRFEDGPATKKNKDKYVISVSGEEIKDEHVSLLTNTAIEQYECVRDLVDKYNMLIIEINNISTKLDALVGTGDKFSDTLYRQSGAMFKNFAALEYTILRNSDLQRRRVVLDICSKIRNPPELIVDRITPKRIFVRSIGSAVSSQYNWDGSSTFGSSINIEKTFPEGVQEFYSNQQKALKS